MNDNNAVAALDEADRNSPAWAELRRMAFDMALLATADRAEAEDIAQDAFLLAFKKNEDGTRGYDASRPMAPYVHRLVGRLWGRRLRDDDNRDVPSWGYELARWQDGLVQLDVALLAERDELVVKLDETLRGLPDGPREVWLARHHRRRTYAQVAKERGIAEVTARVLLGRAQAALNETTEWYTKEGR